MLVKPICLANLTLHTIAIHGMLEVTLRHAYQHLYLSHLSICFLLTCGHENDPNRIGRERFVPACEKGLYNLVAAKALCLAKGVSISHSDA